MAASRRISVGFHGGQVLSLRVDETEWKGLIEKLAAGGWHDVQSDDGPVRVNLEQISYVTADHSEPHVGFG